MVVLFLLPMIGSGWKGRRHLVKSLSSQLATFCLWRLLYVVVMPDLLAVDCGHEGGISHHFVIFIGLVLPGERCSIISPFILMNVSLLVVFAHSACVKPYLFLPIIVLIAIPESLAFLGWLSPTFLAVLLQCISECGFFFPFPMSVQSHMLFLSEIYKGLSSIGVPVPFFFVVVGLFFYIFMHWKVHRLMLGLSGSLCFFPKLSHYSSLFMF